MRGAIAAGHPLTAEAGAAILRAGGHAVDACLAAAFVSWVCESPLAGPGGGGFMLVHETGSGRTSVLDFFVTVPRAASSAQLLELAVDFDGDTRQLFRTGAAAVAEPLAAAGTTTTCRRAHERSPTRRERSASSETSAPGLWVRRSAVSSAASDATSSSTGSREASPAGRTGGK